jgi:predicted phage replisome organizer
MAMDWLKIMGNVLDHRKIKTFHQGKEGNNLLLLWLVMLIEAGKCGRGGYLMISDNLPYTIENLSMITHIPLPIVKKGLTRFADLDMIDNNDGAIFIKNWSKYQSEDKLKARRENDKIRQQRFREKERNKIQSTHHPNCMSRDSHIGLSHDITLQNKQETRREKRTTTEQARLLLEGTSFAQISDQELNNLEKRHGATRLLQATDIAVETWRRNHIDKHNPGGYLQSLCASLTVPEWYVSFEEREAINQDIQHRKMLANAEQLKIETNENAKTIAMDTLWESLTAEQQEQYCNRARPNFSNNIKPSIAITTIMAKLLAWEEAQ